MFQLLGIPVTIHWTFWLIMAIIGGADQARTAEDWLRVGLFLLAGAISVLVHEFGHALTGRRFGAIRPSVYLQGMGGMCTFQHSAFRRWQDFLVTFAGPLAGYTLAVLSILALGVFPDDGPPLILFLLQTLLLVNLVWSTLNLFPILPLDGGHMLRATLGPRRLRITLMISMVTSMLCVIPALYFGSYIGAILFAYFAWENAKDWKLLARHR